MAETVRLSKATFDRLKAEHEDLTTRGRIDIARKIEAARELGDLSENGDYHAAKEEQGKMEGRIMHLFSLIDTAEIGDPVVVSIRFEGDDEVEKYLIGSIEEAWQADDPIVSPTSPMGAALLGHAAGDKVQYETPTGATLTVEIVSVGD